MYLFENVFENIFKNKTAAECDELWADGKKVDVIICSMYSRLTYKTMGIVCLELPYAKYDVPLQTKGSLEVSEIAHNCHAV